MKRLLIIIVPLIIFASCQKEQITIGTNVSETCYVDHNGAAMRLLIEGNTASSVFLIFVHGGPGTSSYGYNTDYISQHIENRYACVYWDQRNAGASQGNCNGKQLNLSQMTDDLRSVISVLKSRYGKDVSVFILGHSFGGLLAASFMTSGDNQSMVNGWICVDGSHNYPLNDTLTRNRLLSAGQQQIALNIHRKEWEPIVNYCLTHPGPFTLDESQQLESYATDAESYFEEVKKLDFVSMVEAHLISDHLPLTAALMNSWYSSNADFIDDLAKTEFTSALHRVTIPTLILYGQYDFICPKELGDDLLQHLSSVDKKMVISPISGHNMYIQDESFFCDEINAFIDSLL